MLLRAMVIWLAIAAAETVHGILRVRLLNRRLGDRRARQVGVFTGSVIIFALAWSTIVWVGVGSAADCLVVGTLWTTLMLAFDLGLGRFYFGFSWSRLLADLDPRQGGFLGLGLIFLLLSPLLAASLRGLI
jgi:hypothetical protein